MDLNSSSHDDLPFALGSNTKWQQEMMAWYMHNIAYLSIDAIIFKTNQSRVRNSF